MPEIRILSDQVANQIAAGEVVERPVAVLKELVENSIDAGASRIEIEYRNGGKSYLRVDDDGCGMKPDQALLALERHATSKIRKASDLNQVSTFGFRGEALPSIASVSRFLMRSRVNSSPAGTEIFVNGGKMIHCKECGMPAGTRVEVSHLFNSVPGRRKFLKTESTESAHLVRMAKLYALAHPGITFTLIEGGRTVFRSPPCEEVGQRVREIFGAGLSESLDPLEHSEGGLAMHGLIGKLGYSRSTRSEMIFFVNRRPVESKTLSYAVLEAFQTYVPKGRYPTAILFLEIDPASVDVNVHPSKREIRFRDEAKVRSFVLGAVLSRNRRLADPRSETDFIDSMEGKEDTAPGMVPEIAPQLLELYGKKAKPDASADARQVEPDSSSATRENAALGQKEILRRKPVGLQKEPLAQWRYLDRLHGDLVLFASPQGVVALHLEAAYERVRFEQLEDGFRNPEKIASQALLLPESLELDPVDAEQLKSCLSRLRELGFRVEEFGRNFYRLEACPSWLEPAEARQFLLDLLEVAREHGGQGQLEALAREALERQADLRKSSKGELSDQGIVELIDQLLSCRNPYLCPKGRPVYFEVPKRDFETRFKRNL